MTRSERTRAHLCLTGAVLGAFALALTGAACSSGDAVDAPPTASRTADAGRSEAPHTYGVDEVVAASLTRDSLPRPEPQPEAPDLSEPGPEPASESQAFLLPDLGLRAGDGRDHLAEGESLYGRRLWLEAAAHLQVAVEEEPEAWYRSYLLGLSLWKAGDREGAESALRRAAELNPDFTKIHVNLARVLIEAGRPGEALAAADRAVALDPASAVAHYQRGRALAHMGLAVEAEVALRDALDLDPANGDIWNRLGLLCLRQGRDAEAVDALERAVQLRPEPAYVHNNLGLAYERVGRLADAETEFAAVVDRDGSDGRIATSLDRVRALLGRQPQETPESGTAVAVLTPVE